MFIRVHLWTGLSIGPGEIRQPDSDDSGQIESTPVQTSLCVLGSFSWVYRLDWRQNLLSFGAEAVDAVFKTVEIHVDGRMCDGL